MSQGSAASENPWGGKDAVHKVSYYDRNTYEFPDSMKPVKRDAPLPNYLELHQQNGLSGPHRPDHRVPHGRPIGTERAMQDVCAAVQELMKFQKHKNTYILPSVFDAHPVPNVPPQSVHRMDAIVANRQREKDMQHQMATGQGLNSFHSARIDSPIWSRSTRRFC